MDINSAFRSRGICFPVDILSSDETELCRLNMLAYLEKIHWKLTPFSRHKPHLILPWVRELAQHRNILEAIKPILGDDILLWYSVVFVKAPKSDQYVPWHQDATYWALHNQNEGLTVWLALNDVDEQNGSMSYLPGSHKSSLEKKHIISGKTGNLLARGQIMTNIDPTGEEWVSLKAGQASLHHNMIVHRSGPNHSAVPRLGLAFRYIKPDNSPVTLKWMKRSATLVSGTDQFHNFSKDPNPLCDSEGICRRAHRLSVLKAILHTLAGDTSRNIRKKLTDSIPTLFSNIQNISKN
ncbi:MAG: phytanoyl-CoA dioxygenase family protein [Deltaproteobacteria bacterium]|nr:phytanoyl-CoA dioxygenase family protein [Deltaproteobacteria bacterium]